jgi:hypothetical protein
LHVVIYAKPVHGSFSRSGLSFESEGRGIEFEMLVPAIFPWIEQWPASEAFFIEVE